MRAPTPQVPASLHAFSRPGSPIGLLSLHLFTDILLEEVFAENLCFTHQDQGPKAKAAKGYLEPADVGSPPYGLVANQPPELYLRGQKFGLDSASS